MATQEGKSLLLLCVLLTNVIRSAAIYGLRNKSNVSIFIMHPKGRVSPIQEAQMTTVTDANVHNIAVKGTFDDCQVCYAVLYCKHTATSPRTGYCKISLRRRRLQQKVPPRCSQLDQHGLQITYFVAAIVRAADRPTAV